MERKAGKREQAAEGREVCMRLAKLIDKPEVDQGDSAGGTKIEHEQGEDFAVESRINLHK